MRSPSQPLTVQCPSCKRPVLWSTDNAFRPFCCERCKLIDLGEWANEEKAIPGAALTLEINNEEHNSLN